MAAANDTELEDGQPVPEDCNEGIRISAIVDALRIRHDQLPSGSRDLLAEALNPPVLRHTAGRCGGRVGSGRRP